MIIHDKVTNNMLNGTCDCCDQDPAQCFCVGYCIYDDETEEQYEEDC